MEIAHFAIRFSLRQIGVPDKRSAQIIAEGGEIFAAAPTDNRRFQAFTYDEKHPTALPPL